MSRLWLAIGAINGMIAVAAGAYAAHGFAGSPEQLRLMDTATLAQMAHALALAAVSWITAASPSSWGKALASAAGAAFTAGILLFCGTLYTLALRGAAPFGVAAPLGGVLLIAGWAALLVRALAGPLLAAGQRVGTGFSPE